MSRRELALPVQGMTCASCVAHVEEALRAVPGVLSVAVNLATERAALVYEEERAGPADFLRAVREAGYEVPEETLVLPIAGMTCASCVSHVEEALR
ncbi:MAG: cation transporter, partial [Chloroflexia bacterium]